MPLKAGSGATEHKSGKRFTMCFTICCFCLRKMCGKMCAIVSNLEFFHFSKHIIYYDKKTCGEAKTKFIRS